MTNSGNSHSTRTHSTVLRRPDSALELWDSAAPCGLLGGLSRARGRCVAGIRQAAALYATEATVLLEGVGVEGLGADLHPHHDTARAAGDRSAD